MVSAATRALRIDSSTASAVASKNGPMSPGESATDAPLMPTQCRRLAQRATVGLARVGGYGDSFSGDIFLAFATGSHLARSGDGPQFVQVLSPGDMGPFFEATAEAVEES